MAGNAAALDDPSSFGLGLVLATEYLGFDPFGGATIIRPSDGCSHDVTLACTGSRGASGTVSIAMAEGSESPWTTTEEYDYHARLVRRERDARLRLRRRRARGVRLDDVQHCYVNYVDAPSNVPARVDNYWWPNGVTNPCLTYSSNLRREALDVDGFGRPWREYRKMFDGSWAQRLTTYNGLGWTTSASEWQQYPVSQVRKTEYLGFDPFGRPGTIRPADGSAHDTTLTWAGVRLMTTASGTSRRSASTPVLIRGSLLRPTGALRGRSRRPPRGRPSRRRSSRRSASFSFR